VLELLCEGRTNASIAAKLVISPKTSIDIEVTSAISCDVAVLEMGWDERCRLLACCGPATSEGPGRQQR
jgi:hypothetical protein